MAATLGHLIRRRRIELGLTQEQLAERVGTGVRQTEISRLEHDRITLPRRARLEQIARALDIPLGVLLASSGWTGAHEAFDLPGSADQPAATQPSPERAPPLPHPDSAVHALIGDDVPDLQHELARARELMDHSSSVVRDARTTMRRATQTMKRSRALSVDRHQHEDEPMSH